MRFFGKNLGVQGGRKGEVEVEEAAEAAEHSLLGGFAE